MSVARDPQQLEPARRAAAIGKFDGVHVGHRRIIESARAAGLRTVAVTFDPLPATAFGVPIDLLTSVQRRLELLGDLGVDDVLVLRFDEQLASLTAEEFAEAVLRVAGVEVVVIGAGFRFGNNRQGDADLLRRLGFDVREVPLVESVSSTHIRGLLKVGDVAAAARLLGRPPEVEGIVVHGDHRGRTLGFPTANLETPAGVLVPTLGIYAGATHGHRAAVSIGTNPTYGGTVRRVEAHLLDFDGDLYGRRLVVELWEHLREELRFASEHELIEAIATDCARTRLAERP